MDEQKINRILVREDVVVPKKIRVLYWIRDVFIYLFFILMVFLGISYVTHNWFSIVSVHGESMLPTYHEGQLLLVNKYQRDFQRGDIVIVDESLDTFNKYYVIKRIIGMPGDLISFDSGSNTIYVNGKQLDESYINESTYEFPDEYNSFTVPEDSVFIMGDNRNNSYDSRDYGPVKITQIIGKTN